MNNIITKLLLITAFFLLGLEYVSGPSILEQQLMFPRVQQARMEKESSLEQHFANRGIPYPPSNLYFRVFKSEKTMEVWAQGYDSGYKLVKSYPVCAMSGGLGPKKKQGDKQVPEGFYNITEFNPQSTYHLSLRVDYPNSADRSRSNSRRLGGDIYVHGECGSRGCVSITNPYIKEVYWLAALAKNNGQYQIPVHIFPARLSDLKFGILKHLYRRKGENIRLWGSLKRGFDQFESFRRPPYAATSGDSYVVQ